MLFLIFARLGQFLRYGSHIFLKTALGGAFLNLASTGS